MEYFEKREYSDGIKYVRVVNLVPGITYYMKCVDENNQIYFSPVSTPPVQTNYIPVVATGPSPGMTYVNSYRPAPETSNTPGTESLVNFPGYSRNEVESARGLHLGITITSIFLPTLLYIIGFPFCYQKLKGMTERTSHPGITGGMKTYTGLGWTTWCLHLATLITFCTFWIPQCRTYYYYYGYYGGSTSYQMCSPTVGGIIAVIIFPVLTFIFSIVTTVVGAYFVNSLPIAPGSEFPTFVV